MTQGGDRLVLLGTKGGPRITGYAPSPTGHLLVLKGVPYVIDAGYGVSFKLVDAGMPLHMLRTVLVTHHHSDHNLDLGPMLYNSWACGLRDEIAVHGPAGTRALISAYWESNRFDIETRIADEGRPDLRSLVRVHEFGEGLVFQNPDVTVTALRVVHPPVTETYALKFQCAGRTIVFSSDTAYFPPLAEFAKGADCLVHEVMYRPGLEKLIARNPNAASLMEHLLASHTVAEDVGRIATAAEVKRLVLGHFVPGDDKQITEQDWRGAVATTFAGEIVVGRDLLEIAL